ncbi:MAG: SpoIIE family protein phosphatase [Candidatus Aegiribacteria sp.]|nr:SpoIIE family protein phosphatase [Candidatus Aegiribacteria sp.]
MGKSELELVLDVLSKAILRETLSFNYYFKAGKDSSLPDGVRGLLTQLAEEERIHRKLLLTEYTSIQKGWSGNDLEGEESGSICYTIPVTPDFIPLAAPDNLDMKAVSLPARLVGGDNILARIVRKRGSAEIGLFVTLYDVMGHSIETTRINSMAASVLGEYLDGTFSSEADEEMLSPAMAVTHLNTQFSNEFEGKGIFLTLFSAYFDLARNRIVYTTAGHEPPMLRRKNGKVDTLFNTQLVIGIDSRRKYEERSIPFDHGDTLCFFSDGILEAKNPEGDYYGRQRLSDTLSGYRGKSSEETLLGILEDLREFSSGEQMEDELTIAVISCCRT